MKTVYKFRIIIYASGLKKCYYCDTPENNKDPDFSKWKFTGISVPEALKARGLKVEIEYQQKKGKEK